MDEYWKKIKIWALAASICLLILGVVMIVWPEVSAVAVCCIMAALCIVLGVSEIVRYFRLGVVGVLFRNDLALGICSVLLGVLLLIQPSGAVVFLPIAVGFYLIMDSVLCIQVSAELHRCSFKNWWAALLWGIAGMLFAFMLLIDPFTGAAALMIFVGVSLIVGSTQSIYAIACISKSIKSGRSGRIIDANWKDED